MAKRALAQERSARPGLHPSRRRVLVSWLVFLAIVAVMMVALQTWREEVFGFVAPLTARMTGAGLSLLGANVRVSGSTVRSSVYTLKVINECTAVMPAVLFVAAVMAYPCRWRSKLLGVLLGLPAIALINVVRLVSLCYVGRYYPEAFDTAHLLVWQSLIVFFAMLIWIVWATVLARGHETTPA